MNENEMKVKKLTSLAPHERKLFSKVAKILNQEYVYRQTATLPIPLEELRAERITKSQMERALLFLESIGVIFIHLGTEKESGEMIVEVPTAQSNPSMIFREDTRVWFHPEEYEFFVSNIQEKVTLVFDGNFLYRKDNHQFKRAFRQKKGGSRRIKYLRLLSDHRQWSIPELAVKVESSSPVTHKEIKKLFKSISEKCRVPAGKLCDDNHNGIKMLCEIEFRDSN